MSPRRRSRRWRRVLSSAASRARASACRWFPRQSLRRRGVARRRRRRYHHAAITTASASRCHFHSMKRAWRWSKSDVLSTTGGPKRSTSIASCSAVSVSSTPLRVCQLRPQSERSADFSFVYQYVTVPRGRVKSPQDDWAMTPASIPIISGPRWAGATPQQRVTTLTARGPEIKSRGERARYSTS